jgi:hypothetical protein
LKKAVPDYGRHGARNDLGFRSGQALYFFNKVWLEFTGCTMEQKLEEAKRVHPDDVERCIAMSSASLDARRSF